MDNREYDPRVGKAESIMGARLDFAGGIKQDSTSGVYLGLNYMYEYGGELDGVKPSLNMYYEINRSDFAFLVGAFSKEKMIDFPLFMFSDSWNYYQPNMGGMAFEFRRKWGKQNIFVDWTGRRSSIRREAFIVGVSGIYRHKVFYLENFGYMFHHALTSGSNAHEHIRDNGVGALFFGVDFSAGTLFDILRCDVGVLGNYNRTRPADLALYGGVMGRLNAHYKHVGVELTSYRGYDLHVPLGDPLYLNGHYTRLDLCAIPLRGKYLESVFKWSLHFTAGVLSSSQQFFVMVRF